MRLITRLELKTKTEAELLKLWQGIPARFVRQALSVYSPKSYWRHNCPKRDMAMWLVTNNRCNVMYDLVSMETVAVDAKRRMKAAARLRGKKTIAEALQLKRKRLLSRLSQAEARKLFLDLVRTAAAKPLVGTQAWHEVKTIAYQNRDDAMDRAYLATYIDLYLGMENLIRKTR